MKYENFKILTIEADEVITKAKDLRAVSDDFAEGFHKAMWEAREIFMKLEDESEEVKHPKPHTSSVKLHSLGSADDPSSRLNRSRLKTLCNLAIVAGAQLIPALLHGGDRNPCQGEVCLETGSAHDILR